VAVTGHATPMVAAIAMSTSSLIVTLNALRLQRAAAVGGRASPMAAAAPMRERAA
jgi:Cu2+-exporting ATPase